MGAAQVSGKEPIIRSRRPAGGGSICRQISRDSDTHRDDATTGLRDQSSVEKSSPSQIDKSVLVFSEPRRLRDRGHIRHVMKQPCLICGRRPSDPHHLRFAQSRALGRKVSDEFTVPLCRGHHRELHRHGDEAGWWRKIKIDPVLAARSLWLQTHPLLAAPA
jgi:hypothetical protein